MRRTIWLALALVSLAVGLWALARQLRPETEIWVRVERRDLVVSVEVEGELEAVESAQLGPPQVSNFWNFKISWMAEEGSDVEPGMPVLAFDATQLEHRLQEKLAERDSAEKHLEKEAADLEIERRGLEQQKAEAESRRRRAGLKLDVPEDVVSTRELEKARIDGELAELEISSLTNQLRHLEARGEADLRALRDKRDRAAARVANLQADIESMNVKAPRAGTLIYTTDWRGEKKKVSDTVWRAAKVVEIPDLERMMAGGEVAEAHIGRVEVGQAVTLRLDAHPDQQYAGRVRSIRRAVQRKSRRNPKKIVKLEIELESTDIERMRPGMRFRGEIEIERVVDTLVVPREAVFPRPGGAAVYVRTLMGRREVVPRFGARNRDGFGVLDGLDGLEEGDWVLRRGGGEEGPEL